MVVKIRFDFETFLSPFSNIVSMSAYMPRHLCHVLSSSYAFWVLQSLSSELCNFEPPGHSE